MKLIIILLTFSLSLSTFAFDFLNKGQKLAKKEVKKKYSIENLFNSYLYEYKCNDINYAGAGKVILQNCLYGDKHYDTIVIISGVTRIKNN